MSSTNDSLRDYIELEWRHAPRRATTVVGYLTKGGIDGSRISQKGFGEACLVLDDDHAFPPNPLRYVRR